MDVPPFLRLAAEIRNQIYGYLLSTKYTKHWPKEEDPEWEYQPESGRKYYRTARPTHIYRFHVAILSANRQINREASNVLYDQNMFVELTSDLTEWDINFKWLGVPVVAQGLTASRFVYTALHIEVKPEQTIPLLNESSIHLVFAGADLPAFCTALLIGGQSPDAIIGSSLLINLNCNTTAEDNPERASFSVPVLKGLLEPLRSLRRFGFSSITGPLDEEYKRDLCLSICRQGPFVKEYMFKVMAEIREGKKASENTDISHYCRYRKSIRILESAMIMLKDRCSAVDRVPVHSLYNERHKAYIILILIIRSDLARAYCELEEWDQGRKWSGRFMTLVEKTRTQYLRYFPAKTHITACWLHGRCNNKLGQWEEAIASMSKAVALAPQLEGELKNFKTDLQDHKERNLKAVKMALERRRDKDGRPLVLKYPRDFDWALSRTYMQANMWDHPINQRRLGPPPATR